jgi:hypothetical protein
MKKQFLKIAGVTREADFYKKYPTEEAFFAAHPEAKKMAMGGTPEAYPQIATFDKAFSYGVPPGPQYLATGGSAYPQAQTEAQFFIPIYTDVYNPYNKAMGGSNVEMYPNAKTTPHWGPTNVWFQDGGQEGMPQEQQGQELDRAGAQNRTGAFVSMLKSTAAKSNARTAMNQVGMAKYGKQLSKYAPGGNTNYTVSGNITPYISQQMSPTSSQFASDSPLTYDQQLLNNMRSRGILYDPAYAAAYNNPMMMMMQQMQGYNPMATGYMNNFLPSIYDWNNMNQFMYQVKGSPKYKWKTNVPGEGKKRGVSNMDFLNAIFPELYGDTDAQMKALNDPKYADRRQQWGISEITNTPKGLFGKRRQTTIKFGDFSGTGADAGPSQTPMDLTRKNQPGPVATPSADPVPFTLDDANAQLQQNNPRAKAIMDNLQNALTMKPGQKSTAASPGASSTTTSSTSNTQTQSGTQSAGPAAVGVPGLLQNQPSYTANPQAGVPIISSNITGPAAAAQAASQSPANTRTPYAPGMAPRTSMDAATAQKMAGAADPNRYINQAYIDAQQSAAQQASSLTGAPYKQQVGPLAEPSSSSYSEPVNPYASVMAGNPPVTMTAQPDPNAYLTGAPYRTQVGPLVGPEGFAYGGYTGYKFGGSYNKGDVVYMTDDEIAEFVRNGGQIEEVD